MRLLSPAGCILLLAGVLSAQPPAFEVASVKPSENAGRAHVDTSPAGRLTIDGSLGYSLKWAYDLRNHQLSAPEWLETERYHIAAKAPGPATVTELKLMLQALLTDEFKMVTHRESRDMMVWAMVVIKGGPKFSESKTEGGSDRITNPRKPGSGGTLLRTSMPQSPIS